jgi:hypothetical protein
MSALDVPCGMPYVHLIFDYPFRVESFIVQWRTKVLHVS